MIGLLGLLSRTLKDYPPYIVLWVFLFIPKSFDGQAPKLVKLCFPIINHDIASERAAFELGIGGWFCCVFSFVAVPNFVGFNISVFIKFVKLQ